MPQIHYFQTTDPSKPVLLNMDQISNIQPINEEVLEVTMNTKKLIFIRSTMEEMQKLLQSDQQDT